MKEYHGLYHYDLDGIVADMNDAAEDGWEVVNFMRASETGPKFYCLMERTVEEEETVTPSAEKPEVPRRDAEIHVQFSPAQQVQSNDTQYTTWGDSFTWPARFDTD